METIEEINAEILEIETFRNELFKKQKKVNDQLRFFYDKIAKLNEKKDKIILNSDKKDDLEWLMEFREPESKVKREQREKILKEYGLTGSGYNPQTNQHAIKLTINENDSDEKLENIEKGLLKILPIIKPFSHDFKEPGMFKNPLKMIGIFEHTLSQNGIYNLVVDPNNNNHCAVICHSWSRISSKKEFNSLMDALKHIRKYHYYESKNGNND